MSHWAVQMTTESENQLKADFKAGVVSALDVKVIKRWVAEVESEGIEHAQENATWRDHELIGKWLNHRAISFSFSGLNSSKISIIFRPINSSDCL